MCMHTQTHTHWTRGQTGWPAEWVCAVVMIGLLNGAVLCHASCWARGLTERNLINIQSLSLSLCLSDFLSLYVCLSLCLSLCFFFIFIFYHSCHCSLSQPFGPKKVLLIPHTQTLFPSIQALLQRNLCPNAKCNNTIGVLSRECLMNTLLYNPHPKAI